MPNRIVYLIVALLGGIGVGFQSPIAGAMGQRIGGTASSLIVHVSGTLFSAALLALRGGENIREWHRLPWYMLIAGLFGLILYQVINFTLPQLGGATMIALIIVGQLLVGVVVDHFGWFGVPCHPISLTRFAGMAILLLGSYLVAK